MTANIILSAVLAVFGVIDLREHKVHNPMLPAAALVCFISGAAGGGLIYALSGATAGALITLIFWKIRIIGGGDVKLLTICGMLTGVEGMLELLRWSVLCAGAGGAVYIVCMLAQGKGISEAAKAKAAFIPYCFAGSLIMLVTSALTY